MRWKSFLQRLLQTPQQYAPWLYLLVCVLAYAPLIPSLGFYWDDWPTIFYTHSGRDAQLFAHFTYDRPYSAWVYYLIGRLGTGALLWHSSALLLRWLGVLAFAWALKAIWPKAPRFVTAAALLFAVYPGYNAQPLPAIFVAHLVTQLAFLLSLGCMAYALREPGRYRRYTALALLTALSQVFMLEYFVGLELVRPLVIWLIVGQSLPIRAAVRKIWLIWWPYLVVLLTWVIWRFWLLELPYEPYPLDVRNHPLQTALDLAQTGLRDLAFTLLGAWREALLSLQATDWLAWAATLGVAGGLVWLLPRTGQPGGQPGTARQAGWLGLLAFAAGMAPIWLTGNELTQNEYSQRYLLIAMFGAALLLAALLSLLRSPRAQTLLLAVLVGVAAGSHIRNAQAFRLDWINQRDFYAQLTWRAPQIKPNTAIVTEDRITPWTGQPLTSYMLNTLYPVRAAAPFVDLWHFESRFTATFNSLMEGETLQAEHRGLIFEAQSPQHVLVIAQVPDGCLWVLEAVDRYNPYLTEEDRALAEISNVGVILTDANAEPVAEIFATDPLHDWCFFFQKAKLANQQGLWNETIKLMQTAATLGFSPKIDIEWLPLAEALAQTGQWDQAREVSLRASSSLGNGMVCALWREWQSLGNGAAATALVDCPAD
ncbi:MAG: hypothetical protein KIS80_03530 [Anaerolineales bacterium]|nr:hypothetical protein [Anaerolineales bacterium]